MRVLLTGGTGYLGGFIARALDARGDAVVHLSRRRPAGAVEWLPFDLAAPPDALPAADALVHAAFDHVPGRYRGGEGDDPEGFLARNRDGSLALFAAARAAGIGRHVFLSTRAVYGAWPPGTALTEDLPPRPDTLYGTMKHEVETALWREAGPDDVAASLRITGVYGQAAPGGWHKWAEMFAAFEAGETPPPRCGTEVHGADMAAAVTTVLDAAPGALAAGVFNVSDILLDRRDLLARLAARRDIATPLPDAAPPPGPNVMACERLAALGWRPGGIARLDAFLDGL